MAAALAPRNLAWLGGGAAAGVLAAFAWWGLVPLVFFASALLYGRGVLALAGDKDFARQALAAADPTRRSLRGSKRLKVLAKFGKLPAEYKARVERLQAVGEEVERRLGVGAGSALDGHLARLAPKVQGALVEAVDLAADGAEAAGAGKDTAATEARLDRIVEILESMKADLITMETEPAALPGDRVVLQLEDLSSEVSVLKDSLAELGE